MIFITLLVEGYGCRLKALGGIQGSDRDLGLLCHLTGLGSGQLHQVSFPCVPVIDHCQDLTICGGCGIGNITAVNITVQPAQYFGSLLVCETIIIQGSIRIHQKIIFYSGTQASVAVRVREVIICLSQCFAVKVDLG